MQRSPCNDWYIFLNRSGSFFIPASHQSPAKPHRNDSTFSLISSPLDWKQWLGTWGKARAVWRIVNGFSPVLKSVVVRATWGRRCRGANKFLSSTDLSTVLPGSSIISATSRTVQRRSARKSSSSFVTVSPKTATDAGGRPRCSRLYGLLQTLPTPLS